MGLDRAVVEGTPPSGIADPRVLLEFEGDIDQEPFVEWFAERHDVCTPDVLGETGSGPDVCVLDAPALERHRDALVARRDQDGVFLPVVLVVDGRTLEGTRERWNDATEEAFRPVADEVVTTPVRAAELRRRITGLLERRSLSGDLLARRERHNRLLAATSEAVLTLATDGTISDANAAATDLFGVDSTAALRGRALRSWLHEEDRDPVAGALGAPTGVDEATLDARLVAADGTVSRVEMVVTPLDAGEAAAQVVVSDVSARHEHEREIERQRTALRKLDRLNATIRDVDEALVAGSGREEIEQAVCEELVRTDRYVFAWIGRARADADEIESRTSAGRGDDYLDEVLDRTDEDRPLPAARAIATRETEVVGDVESIADPPPWCEAARERDFRSIVAVPLRYGETVYGALAIYAAVPHAFDDRERAVLRLFGSTVGHAISAAESRQALRIDRHREVEFEIEAEGFLAAIARAFECPFELTGQVPQPGSSVLEYYVSSVDDPERVIDAAESADEVAHARHVGTRDGRPQFEFAFAADLVTRIFGDVTATVEALEIRAGRYALTANVPYEVDLHTLVTAVERRHESVSLRAQREAERSHRTEQDTRQAFVERLTDRQWSVLLTAYHAGYFEWPRESSGEEVAASLGISPSTFHEHLRTAQRKLLATLLE